MTQLIHDLLLTDDDLVIIVAALEEGRRVSANSRRFLLYGLFGGAAQILAMLVGSLFGLLAMVTAVRLQGF